MTVYRIAKWKFLEDLSGTGARLYGGRWNKIGFPVIYTSAHLSLSVLEILANTDTRIFNDTYGYISIQIPDGLITKLNINDLPTNWRKSPYISQTVNAGTNWLKSKGSLGLIVPSSVLHQETNVLINPMHPDFSEVKITFSGKVDLDGRI